MFFQHVERIAIPAGGTPVVYELPASSVLDNLTIWVVGAALTNNLAVQPQINGQNFGASVTILSASGPPRDIVFQSTDGTNGRRLIPFDAAARTAPGQTPPYRFVFTLLLTPGVAAEDITIYAVADDLSET